MAAGRVPAANRAASTRIESIGDLPGLKWWVEPDSIVATDAVDSWTDKSGLGNTITETGTNRPTLVSSVLDGYNGIQVVAASSQRLRKLNSPLITGRAFTFGLVMRVDANIANARYFCNGIISSSGLEFCDAAGLYSPTFAGVANQPANALSLGAFHMFVYRVAGPLTNGFYRYDRAATAMTSTLGFINPSASAPLILGARDNLTLHSSATFVAGFLCDRFLTEVHVAFIEQTWKTKYPTLA